jgi:hypothetical protein
MAQHSVRTAFLFEAEEPFKHLSTSGNWHVRRRLDRDFAMMGEGIGDFYIDVGPGEIFIVDDNFEHEAWHPAHRICRAEVRGELGGGSPWTLIPRSIPLERIGEEVLPKRAIIRMNGTENENSIDSLSLKAGGELILDFGELVVGYPSIWLCNDSAIIGQVSLTYCESLVDSNGRKENRNDSLGRAARGYEDRIEFKGCGSASINPSWLRTFRYVSVKTSVGISGLEFKAYRAGYPLFVEASFDTDEPTIEPIWNMSVRTLKLCAGETYYDCPYYEQLQYIGDTRLQALIGYYLSRDRHLQRNAIEQFHWSILENGLTQSRYPSRQMQVIPPFSLWWVVMLYDAWMHDPGFNPKPYLHSAVGVLKAFQKVQSDELEPFWCFGDWVPEWKWGVPPGGPNAEMHTVLFEMAKWCLETIFIEVAPDELGQTGNLGPLGPISPSSPKSNPSEHSEALWRYWQVLAGQTPDPWHSDDSLAKCTYFWQYYKHVALQPENYLDLLGPWREMLELGLTTTPETPEPTRSDCHGWSAHPPLSLLQLVAGVTSTAPGWSKARIAPRPGSLSCFKAVIPHPSGDIEVGFAEERLVIKCPVPFEFVWKGNETELDSGNYEF